MKKIFIIGCILFVTSTSFSQKLDLIVTLNGDSIACQIDSISNSHIFFEMIANDGDTVKTLFEIEKIKEFKEDFIVKKVYDFKPGTSIITGINYSIGSKSYSKQNLEQVSLYKLDNYLAKAKKLRTTGGILFIAGPLLAFAGMGMAIVYGYCESQNAFLFGSGVVLFFVGAGATVVGLPILIIGLSRVKRIKNIKKFTSDGVYFEIAPCTFHNNIARSYQSGITLQIRF